MVTNILLILLLSNFFLDTYFSSSMWHVPWRCGQQWLSMTSYPSRFLVTILHLLSLSTLFLFDLEFYKITLLLTHFLPSQHPFIQPHQFSRPLTPTVPLAFHRSCQYQILQTFLSQKISVPFLIQNSLRLFCCLLAIPPTSFSHPSIQAHQLGMPVLLHPLHTHFNMFFWISNSQSLGTQEISAISSS